MQIGQKLYIAVNPNTNEICGDSECVAIRSHPIDESEMEHLRRVNDCEPEIVVGRIHIDKIDQPSLVVPNRVSDWQIRNLELSVSDFNSLQEYEAGLQAVALRTKLNEAVTALRLLYNGLCDIKVQIERATHPLDKGLDQLREIVT